MSRLHFNLFEKAVLRPKKILMKIIIGVFAVHMAFIFLPLSWHLVKEKFTKNKKKESITVKLISQPRPIVPKTAKKITSEKSTVKKTQKQRTKTVQKKVVRRRQQPPKKVVKRTPPKKDQRPAAKNVKRRTAQKNRRTVTPKKTAKQQTTPPVRRQKYTPPSPPDDLEIITDKTIRREIIVDNDEKEDNEAYATYTEQIVSILYSLWTPPSEQLLHGRKPRVTVKIRFNRSGRIIEKRIVSKSDFAPMDRSIIDLLRNLSQIPAPPDGHKLELELVFVPQE